MNKSGDMKTTLILIVGRGQSPAARRVVAPCLNIAPKAELKTVPCGTCYGTGRSMSEPRACRVCAGRGWLLGLPKELPATARPKAQELTFSI